jgi:hypothetical protein
MPRATLRSPVLLLGIAAAVSVMVAILTSFLMREPKHHPFAPEAYFPGLEARLSTATRIHLQSKEQSVDLAFAPETNWTVSSKDGYRARYDEIQRLLLALSGLERFERKSSDAKWHKRLLLTDPREKGEATLVSVMDGQNKPIAEILIGLNADVDNVGDKGAVYVRKPGDNQVWLARGEGVSTLTANPDDWLDKLIIDLPKDLIARVEVKPESGAPYTLVRDKPEDKAFTLEGAAGAKLRSTDIDALAGALADLRLRDVARQDRITFTETSPTATFRTGDGLLIRIEVAKLGEDFWARLTPSSAQGATGKAKSQAESLKRRLSPWVFAIERWKGEQLTAARASLFEAAPEQAQAPKSPDVNVKGGAHSGNAAPTDEKFPPASLPTHQGSQKQNPPVPNKRPKTGDKKQP